VDRGRGGVTTTADRDGPIVVTDENGAFVFEDLSRTGVALGVQGQGIIWNWYELDHGGIPIATDMESLELVVERSMHLQVKLTDPVDDAFVQVLDATGEALSIIILKGASRDMSNRIRLSAGKTPVLSVSERAATVVLFRGREEIMRSGVTLNSSSVTRLVF
jgi:hypothetical protein